MNSSLLCNLFYKINNNVLHVCKIYEKSHKLSHHGSSKCIRRLIDIKMMCVLLTFCQKNYDSSAL